MSEQINQSEHGKKTYTYQDLVKFSDINVYSGFGEVKVSQKPSAPKFSFGTATRAAGPKKFQNNDMAKIDCFGKQTPKGPNYNVTDKYAYNKGPEWKVGTQPRNTLDTKAKYDHYFRKDLDLDINEADKNTRTNVGNTRFGGASRFPTDQKKYKMTPGPQYSPPIHPQGKKQPQFSLYDRRAVKGMDPLIQMTSTSEIVGPGAYHPENSVNPSQKSNFPHYSMPKGPRDPTHKNRWQLNQTYDNTSSIGNQKRSDKTSKPSFTIGKEKRGQTKSGIFSAHMEQKPMSIRMNHVRF